MKSISEVEKYLIDNRDYISVAREKIYSDTFPRGIERRKAILDFITMNGGMHVNRSWCLCIKNDTDLKYLLKKGKIKTVRTGLKSSRRTVLVLA